jgi:hypothetical protein
MKKKATKVSFLGKKDDKYMLKFPNLHVKVSVNEELYAKMLQSSLYDLKPVTNEKLNSA